jgi:hypothetical protein
VPTVAMTGAQWAELAARRRQTGILLVTGAAGNVGRSAVFRAKESGWVVIAGVRKKRTEAGKDTGADRVIALDDVASMRSLEPLILPCVQRSWFLYRLLALCAEHERSTRTTRAYMLFSCSRCWNVSKPTLGRHVGKGLVPNSVI